MYKAQCKSMNLCNEGIVNGVQCDESNFEGLLYHQVLKNVYTRNQDFLTQDTSL